MSKQMPYMVLDLSKKPGDENAVKTGDMLLAENERMREALVAVKKSIDEMGAASLGGDPEILLMSLTQVCARLSARIEAALAEGREGVAE